MKHLFECRASVNPTQPPSPRKDRSPRWSETQRMCLFSGLLAAAVGESARLRVSGTEGWTQACACHWGTREIGPLTFTASPEVRTPSLVQTAKGQTTDRQRFWGTGIPQTCMAPHLDGNPGRKTDTVETECPPPLKQELGHASAAPSLQERKDGQAPGLPTTQRLGRYGFEEMGHSPGRKGWGPQGAWSHSKPWPDLQDRAARKH